MAKKDAAGLDKYHYHEALDRAAFVMEIIDVLTKHPVMVARKLRLANEIDALENAAGALYSAVANLKPVKED